MSGELIKLYSSEEIPEFKYLIYIHNNILTSMYDDITDYLNKLKIEFLMNKKSSVANSRIKFKTLNDYMMFKLYFMDTIQKAYILTPYDEIKQDYCDYYNENDIKDKLIYIKACKIKPIKVKADYTDLNFYPKNQVDSITPEQIIVIDKKEKIKQAKKQKQFAKDLQEFKMLFVQLYNISTKSNIANFVENINKKINDKGKIDGVDLYKKFINHFYMSYKDYEIYDNNRLFKKHSTNQIRHYIHFHIFKKHFPDVKVNKNYFIEPWYNEFNLILKEYFKEELDNGQQLDFI